MRQNYIKIFDIDGTVADTEPFHLLSYNILFKRHNLGINLSKQDWASYIGNSEEVIFESIFNNHKLDKPESFDELIEERIGIFLEILDNLLLRKFPDVEEEIINSQGCHYIFSSQRMEVIEKILDNTKLSQFFGEGEFVCCSRLGVSKMEVLMKPEYYFSGDLEDCELFEDSVDVLEFAHKLGYKTTGIMTDTNKNNFNIASCDRVFNEIIY